MTTFNAAYLYDNTHIICLICSLGPNHSHYKLNHNLIHLNYDNTYVLSQVVELVYKSHR